MRADAARSLTAAMPDLSPFWTAFGLALAISAFGLAPLIPVLRRRLLDRVTARSGHAAPTPRGAGLIVVPAILLAWAAASGDLGTLWPFLVGAVALAMVSFVDDSRGHVPPLVRLAIQAGAVALPLAVDPGLLAGLGLPWPDWVLFAGCVVSGVWFLNLFNFMDGADGLSAVQTLVIAAGVIAVLTLVPGALDGTAGLLAAALAGGALGFFVWNRPVASVFLGDVGSVPIGYLLAVLLLIQPVPPVWAIGLILPAYYWLDATSTVVTRFLAGKKVWRAHREHAYQRGIDRGLSVPRLLIHVALAGAVSIGLARWAAVTATFEAALIAAGAAWGVTGLLILHLRTFAPSALSGGPDGDPPHRDP